jgi:hypothetical protein
MKGLFTPSLDWENRRVSEFFIAGAVFLAAMGADETQIEL